MTRTQLGIDKINGDYPKHAGELRQVLQGLTALEEYELAEQLQSLRNYIEINNQN